MKLIDINGTTLCLSLYTDITNSKLVFLLYPPSLLIIPSTKIIIPKLLNME